MMEQMMKRLFWCKANSVFPMAEDGYSPAETQHRRSNTLTIKSKYSNSSLKFHRKIYRLVKGPAFSLSVPH